MRSNGAGGEVPQPLPSESPTQEAATLPQRLLLLSTGVLVLAILLGEGDNMPDISSWDRGEAKRLLHAPEVSPYQGSEPFRVHNTTHAFIPIYSHTREGWTAYLFGALGAVLTFLVSWLAFPRDPVRRIQLFELEQTLGMISGGAFSSYPRFPVPTKYHGTGSNIAALTRKFIFRSPVPFVSAPLLASLVFAQFERTRPLIDIMSVGYALLDMWPSLVGEFHVNERPTHNLRLLVLALGSTASRHRAWGAIMGMFYIATGAPKLFPSFYRYWLWFGIYPSSTLSDFPPSLFFSKGEDGGWHPNFLAQAFGFFGGALEVTLAMMMLAPAAWNRRLRAVLATATHVGIIFGRFDNGLAGWNSYWLLEDLLHVQAPEHSASWAALSPLAGTVVAAQGTLTLLFFMGHGSYHSGMSHHTGNFRMQWLLFHDEATWQQFEEGLRPYHGTVCQHGPLHGAPTCPHTWGHGTHYPGASFSTFLYALNGGTYLPEVLPPSVIEEGPGFGEGLERLGPDRSKAEQLYTAERTARTASDGKFLRQVSSLVGTFNRSVLDGDRARAVYLGFASGGSVWDDSFYEPLVAETLRENLWFEPGRALFVEVDRQRPWRRTRRLRVWDLSRSLHPSPRSLLDQMLGSSPKAHLVGEWRLTVRRPFPCM